VAATVAAAMPVSESGIARGRGNQDCEHQGDFGYLRLHDSSPLCFLFPAGFQQPAAVRLYLARRRTGGSVTVPTENFLLAAGKENRGGPFRPQKSTANRFMPATYTSFPRTRKQCHLGAKNMSGRQKKQAASELEACLGLVDFGASD
jgi:hypothetical protein